jgi:cysteinyl-tRNA synthetase
MPLTLYNTLSRSKEVFEPMQPPFVGMYVCGPTVYGHAHLGHAKSYVSFDLLFRYLKYKKYNVRYVQNITDVGHLTDDADEGEDKIAKKARAERVEPMEIVESYTKSYYDDMDSLNVIRPDIAPRASGHIIEQIEMVKSLIAKGNAYEVNGTVYFDVRSFKDYGKLSGRSLDAGQSGTRVDVKSDKKNPEDFALWKKADATHLMKWPSPWGEGFPGWHIECSAMAMKYLGNTIDIHGGGLENQFPHHECEIAQSEAHTGQSFAKYWIHNNMVTRDGVKMGKSLGNSISLKEAIDARDGMTVRFFVLNNHYRSTLDYSEHALDSAQKGLKRLLAAFKELDFRISYHAKADGKPLPFKLAEFEERFFEALDNDLSTPEAIATLFELVKEINSLGTKQYKTDQLEQVKTFFKLALDDILGLLSPFQTSSSTEQLDGVLRLVVELRDKARFDKDFTLSDKIRDRMAELGIEFRDTPDGTKWQTNL